MLIMNPVLIDRQKAAEQLLNSHKHSDVMVDPTSDFGKGYIQGKKAQKDIDVNEILEMRTPWIPVSEELPEEDKDVLAYTESGSMVVANYTCDWGQMVWTTGDFGSGTLDVVAWMELPEPYKG